MRDEPLRAGPAPQQDTGAAPGNWRLGVGLLILLLVALCVKPLSEMFSSASVKMARGLVESTTAAPMAQTRGGQVGGRFGYVEEGIVMSERDEAAAGVMPPSSAARSLADPAEMQQQRWQRPMAPAAGDAKEPMTAKKQNNEVPSDSESAMEDHNTAEFDQPGAPVRPKPSERERKDLLDSLGKAKEERQAARPMRFLPRSLYFENTYLGGVAAAIERQRRLDEAWGTSAPYQHADLGNQAFDTPPTDGLGLTVALDRSWQERAGTVLLQVGIRGSERYGWRRPPLDVAAVIDPSVLLSAPAAVERAVLALVRQLGPQDKLGLVLASSPPQVLAMPQRLRDIRTGLAEHIEQLGTHGNRAPSAALAEAMVLAGAQLAGAAGGGVPGTRTVILLTGLPDPSAIEQGRAAAHQLALEGVVTSVLQLAGGPQHSSWWTIADAGQGNYHRLDSNAALADAVDSLVASELSSLARVVARLVRVNIRLARGVHALRILGSRQLTEEEVQDVKAREQATDRQLAATLGVTADRGDDDDGLQTVIPYFYGGDSHVILVELYIEQPGAVADVSLRYKDMVRLGNAEVHASAMLSATPRADSMQQREVLRNAQQFNLASSLRQAAALLARGQAAAARRTLEEARDSLELSSQSRTLVAELMTMVDRDQRYQLLSEVFTLAADRLVGQPVATTHRH